MNILFHVQHLLGIGHDRRAAAITRGLLDAGHRVTVLRGGFPVPGSDYGAAQIVPLPPARAADATFHPLVDAEGKPIDDDWRANRRRVTLDAFHNTAPDVLLVESYPFARGAFAFELDPLLGLARAENVLTVVSVRDVVVAKTRPGWADTVLKRLERFDAVLVHGDPVLIPFEAGFPEAARIAQPLRHTGFIGTQTPAVSPEGDGAGEVVVSVGGGAVGLPLLRAALAARVLSPLADAPWRLLAGADLPEPDLQALQREAPPEVIVERARRDFPALLARCRLSISQAGYNTVLDVLQAGCHAVLVPFATAKETEQAIRARALAERGRAVVVEEPDPPRLAAAIAEALAAPLPDLPVRLDGAAQTARELDALWHPASWDELHAELDLWAAEGKTATFWWRDDDIERPSPAFERLMALSAAASVPVTLAAIPATVDESIRPLLHPDTYLLQHGHTHAPYTAADGWVYEFCDEHPLNDVLTTMRADRERLVSLFGARALPVMAPPYNRFGQKIADALPSLGLTGLTTFRQRLFNVPGVREVNVHIDPIDWANNQSFRGDGRTLNGAVAHLRARRQGVRSDEPTGLMTHHLPMTEDTWAFVERLFRETKAHPNVRWLTGAEAFA